MDHAIGALEVFYEVTLDWFMEEHREENHKKLSDNSNYHELKALIDAMNILRKYMGWETIKLSEEVTLRMS